MDPTRRFHGHGPVLAAQQPHSRTQAHGALPLPLGTPTASKRQTTPIGAGPSSTPRSRPRQFEALPRPPKPHDPTRRSAWPRQQAESRSHRPTFCPITCTTHWATLSGLPKRSISHQSAQSISTFDQHIRSAHSISAFDQLIRLVQRTRSDVIAPPKVPNVQPASSNGWPRNTAAPRSALQRHHSWDINHLGAASTIGREVYSRMAVQRRIEIQHAAALARGTTLDSLLNVASATQSSTGAVTSVPRQRQPTSLSSMSALKGNSATASVI